MTSSRVGDAFSDPDSNASGQSSARSASSTLAGVSSLLGSSLFFSNSLSISSLLFSRRTFSGHCPVVIRVNSLSFILLTLFLAASGVSEPAISCDLGEKMVSGSSWTSHPCCRRSLSVTSTASALSSRVRAISLAKVSSTPS